MPRQNNCGDFVKATCFTGRHCEELLRRSNPGPTAGGTLDCFTPLAMTAEAIRLFSRGLLSYQRSLSISTRSCRGKLLGLAARGSRSKHRRSIESVLVCFERPPIVCFSWKGNGGVYASDLAIKRGDSNFFPNVEQLPLPHRGGRFRPVSEGFSDFVFRAFWRVHQREQRWVRIRLDETRFRSAFGRPQMVA